MQSGVYVCVSDNKKKGHTKNARSLSLILGTKSKDITTLGQESHQLILEYLEDLLH